MLSLVRKSKLPEYILDTPVKTNGISEYSRYVTYRVSQLSAKMNVQATRLLREHCDLSPVHWRLLALIYVSAPVTSATLVKSIAMDAGQFSRNLKTLINEGMIKSRVDSDDNRRQVLSLTRKGLARYQKAAPIMTARRDALMVGISDSDRETFFRVLDQLDRNLSVGGDAMNQTKNDRTSDHEAARNNAVIGETPA